MPLEQGPESAVDRADLVSSAVTSLGLMAAGLWALFTFVLVRSGVSNLELTIQPELQPFTGDQRMLMVSVALQNTGKVVIQAGSAGCRLWVRSVPMDARPGKPIDLESGEVIVDELDLLAAYDKTFPYEIEPGAEYHEFCALPVAPNMLLAIKATFYFGAEEDDALSERRLVFIE